jgi:hypothetical protein
MNSVQRNGVDCGVWVLVTIATVLLGHTHNTVVEVPAGQSTQPGCIDIQIMRDFFYKLALRVPVAKD